MNISDDLICHILSFLPHMSISYYIKILKVNPDLKKKVHIMHIQYIDTIPYKKLNSYFRKHFFCHKLRKTLKKEQYEKRLTKKEYPDHVEYLVDNKPHREDGPAVIFHDGTLYWCKHGKVHRDYEDGPAVIYADGSREWRYRGMLNRGDGPAIISANGNEYWYVSGTLLD